jgi:uncharacterized protein (DUF2236 family)
MTPLRASAPGGRSEAVTILPDAILLPGPIQNRIEDFARSFLEAPEVPAADFLHPHGEAALTPADSVSWRVFKNPVSLFVGGVAAVLLEFAEPRVRDGVWHNTRFREEPLVRLRRTGLAAMLTVYGPRSKAEAMIQGVVRAHARISGMTSGGILYHANNPDLLDWVQATATYGFLTAYSAYAARLSAAEIDLSFAEVAPAGALYGAHGAPRSLAEFNAIAERLGPAFEPSAILLEFLAVMKAAPIFPAPARPLQRLLVKAAVDLVPPRIRRRLGLGSDWSLSGWQRATVRSAGAAADRLMLRASPSVQSCRRLGLPDDYLYRRPSTGRV